MTSVVFEPNICFGNVGNEHIFSCFGETSCLFMQNVAKFDQMWVDLVFALNKAFCHAHLPLVHTCMQQKLEMPAIFTNFGVCQLAIIRNNLICI